MTNDIVLTPEIIRAARSEIGRIAGSATSPRKKISSAQNGHLSGVAGGKMIEVEVGFALNGDWLGWSRKFIKASKARAWVEGKITEISEMGGENLFVQVGGKPAKLDDFPKIFLVP